MGFPGPWFSICVLGVGDNRVKGVESSLKLMQESIIMGRVFVHVGSEPMPGHGKFVMAGARWHQTVSIVGPDNENRRGIIWGQLDLNMYRCNANSPGMSTGPVPYREELLPACEFSDPEIALVLQNQLTIGNLWKIFHKLLKHFSSNIHAILW